MTNTELREWIKRRGLTQAQAAELLAMSLDGLRKNIQGVTPVGNQTEKLIETLDELTLWVGKAQEYHDKLANILKSRYTCPECDLDIFGYDDEKD